jgi:hypothetical protein
MKRRYCFVCGEEIEDHPDWEPLDTCGKLECDRVAARVEREEESDQ